MKRTRRRLLAGGILLIWFVMLGWQVRREYFQPELARLAEAALTLAPGVNFYSLRMGDRVVGLATSRLDTVPTGFVLDDMLSLELPALGQTGTAVVRTRVNLSPSLTMRDFSFALDSEVGRYRATGSVEGDTLLQVQVEAGGSEQSVTYRLSQPPIFAAVLPIRIAVGEGLAVGDRIRLPVFDPSSLSTRGVEVRVTQHDTLLVPDSAELDHGTGRWRPAHFDSIPSWRVVEAYGGIQVESWIDGDGRILRASSPLGFSMEKTEYELARQAQEDARGLENSPIDEDVILSTAIQSNVDLGEVENYEELRFVLSGVDLEGFQLEGGRQRLRGDTLIVRQETWATIRPDYDELPYPRMDFLEYLQPEPLIQSDDDGIVAAAESLARWRTFGDNDPLQVTRRLTVGIHRTLEKEITFSIPNAVQVLEAGRGDCNEHTVLFVAMARALGLPARTAVGLVYVNEAFFYHAWPEVWLGEWVAVDPTFGQYPADAAHLRFVVGGLAQQVEIVRLIGNLDIEVLRPDSAEGGVS
ncbi:MAG: transglutaminase-like domain-containing protein [Gemmatimonadetes bacterium]|nr:transglutaminase-like domain-containing protein [Gemmatimonadota bacterium]